MALLRLFLSMLEKIPSSVGRHLEKIRSGVTALTWFAPSLSGIAPTISLHSWAIDGAGTLDRRYTADGLGISPPLSWGTVPDASASLALIIEDADSPTPKPIVHAIVLDLPPVPGMLAEGELPTGDLGDSGAQMGINSFFRRRYLAPSPPPGHGIHNYVFQLYALNTVLPRDFHPGRTALVHATEGHVVGRGVLIAQYAR